MKKTNRKLKIVPSPGVPPQPEGAPVRILYRGVNVEPLLGQLAEHPELWDENVFRTERIGDAAYAGPHAKISDIIVRFNDWKNWTGDRAAFNGPHESVWWGPYEKLTYIQPLVFDLARMHFAEQIGMVLITRIPPHCNVEKHVDVGWHAGHYLKFAVQVKAAPGQKFCYDGYSLETRAGDLFAFDNSKPHWVENPTDHERITLIICLRPQQVICRDYQYKGAS
jgi:hypothetical protein